MKPGLRIPNPLPVLPLAATRTRSLHRRRIDDVDPPLRHHDASLPKLPVHLTQKPLPKVVLHKPRPKPTQSRRIRNPAVQLKPAEPPEQKVPTQALRQLHIRKPIPNAEQQAPKQRLKRVTRTTRARPVDRRKQNLKRRPVQERLRIIERVKRRMIQLRSRNEQRRLRQKRLLYEHTISQPNELCRGLETSRVCEIFGIETGFCR